MCEPGHAVVTPKEHTQKCMRMKLGCRASWSAMARRNVQKGPAAQTTLSGIQGNNQQESMVGVTGYAQTDVQDTRSWHTGFWGTNVLSCFRGRYLATKQHVVDGAVGGQTVDRCGERSAEAI